MTLVLGAAMMTAEIPDHIDWLRERDRDLEIQDWFLPAALEDPAPLVAAAKQALDGWSGRLGIHGPSRAAACCRGWRRRAGWGRARWSPTRPSPPGATTTSP